jgi:hypothetical protein
MLAIVPAARDATMSYGSHARRFAAPWSLALGLLIAAGPVHARACELESADQSWVQDAIATWSAAAAALDRPAAPLPWMVLYDQRCVLHVNPRAGRARRGPRSPGVRFEGQPLPARTSSYRKSFRLPNGVEQTSAAVAFTSLAKDGEPFFVMALPSVWRADPRSMPGDDIERFASGVMAHEVTHTLHLKSIAAALQALEGRHPMPDSLNDDYMQRVLGEDADYLAAYDAEIALYARAVSAASDAEAREFARRALAASDQRRTRFFVGEHALFRDVEPVFLDMEGVASWVAYTVTGDGADPIEFAGRWWSQQEGLLLFLLIDRFDPSWKARVFADEVPDPFAMLSRALAAPAG